MLLLVTDVTFHAIPVCIGQYGVSSLSISSSGAVDASQGGPGELSGTHASHSKGIQGRACMKVTV